jgi:hypothetical protein
MIAVLPQIAQSKSAWRPVEKNLSCGFSGKAFEDFIWKRG